MGQDPLQQVVTGQGGKLFFRKLSLALLVVGIVLGGLFFSAKEVKGVNGTTPSVKEETPSGQNWRKDATVTKVGNAAVRARDFLNWSLAIEKTGFGERSIRDLWKFVLGAVTAVYVAILILIAFAWILHLEWGEKARRHFPLILISFALTFLSLWVALLFVNAGQALQKSLMTIDDEPIRGKHLLTVGFEYGMEGYKNIEAPEAADLTLTLTRITTWTSYAIGLIFLLRIIILWGLVIFSPFLFPFLIFPATRNVAIVWVREFFRWLFLGPLFALFLAATVYIWKHTTGVNIKGGGQPSTIPIEVSSVESTDYPSGTNILLGPPGVENLQLETNNLSDPETYSRYVVALAMLWAAIILPWLLLRIIMSVASKATTSFYERYREHPYFAYLTKILPPTPPPKPVAPPEAPRVLLRPEVRLGRERADIREILRETAPERLAERVEEAQARIPAAERATTRERMMREARLRERETLREAVPEKLTERIRETIRERAEKTSTLNLIKQAGLTQISQIIERLVSSRKEAASLQGLSVLEANPQIQAEVKATVDKLKAPERITSPAEREKVSQVKEDILVNRLAGETQAKLLSAVMEEDTSKISQPLTLPEEIITANLKQIVRAVKQMASEGEEVKRIREKGVEKIVTQKAPSITQTLEERVKLGDKKAQLALEAYQEIGKLGEDLGREETRVQAKRTLLGAVQFLQNPSRQIEELGKSFLEKLTALREVLVEWAGRGGKLAQEILRDADLTVAFEDEARTGGRQILERLITGEELEKALINLNLLEDYEKTQAIWKNYYQTSQVPQGQNRVDWISSQQQRLSSVLKGLIAENIEERRAAFKQVSEILPFVLLGNYSLLEIVIYLKAKIKAAEAALRGIKPPAKEELVKVPLKEKEEKKTLPPMEMK